MSYQHHRFIQSAKKHTADLTFAPQGNLLVIRPPTEITIIVDVVSGDIARVLYMPEDYPVRRVVPSERARFSPDGKQLITVDGEWGIVWETTDWTVTHRVQLSGEGFHTGNISFSSDGALLATAGHDTGVSLWETRHWMRLRSVDAFDYVWSVALAPDRRVVAVGYGQHDLRLLELPYLTPMTEVPGWRQVRALTFSPDGSLLAAACGDGFVRLLEVLTGETRAELEADPVHAEKSAGAVVAIFTSDGQRLVTAGGRLVRVWNIVDGRLLQELHAHEKSIRCVALSANDRIIASCGYDHMVHVWQYQEDRELVVV